MRTEYNNMDRCMDEEDGSCKTAHQATTPSHRMDNRTETAARAERKTRPQAFLYVSAVAVYQALNIDNVPKPLRGCGKSEVADDVNIRMGIVYAQSTMYTRAAKGFGAVNVVRAWS